MKSKRITRTRYYCDFCAAEGRVKGFWTRPAIVKHERGCTANPNRICGICEAAIPALAQRPIAELVAVVSVDKTDFGMKELRELTKGCPSCILAAIRQSNIQKPPEGEYDRGGYLGANNWEGPIIDFNFQAELEAFWKNVNETVYENELRRGEF